MIIKPGSYGLFSCIILFLLVSLCIFAKYRFLFWIYKNLPW